MGRRAKRRDDLVRRLCNVLDVAARVVCALAPDGLADADVGVTAEKVVSETAFLLLAAAPAGRSHPDVASRVEAVARLLVPFARGARTLVGMCREPALARDHAFAHACLSRLGYLDIGVDRLLAQCLAAESAGARERVPHRVMEQEWVRRVWNPGGGGRAPRRWPIAQSVLGQPLDALSAGRDDLYALAHALMYVTDLGCRRVRLPRGKAAVLADADAALGRCLDDEDYGLCGELLLAWPYLRAPFSPAAGFALDVVLAVEDEAGFLPAPAIAVERYRKLTDGQRTAFATATACHTVYVMGLLCAATLSSARLARTPPAPPTGCAAALVQLLPDAPKPRHWRGRFDRLGGRARDELAPLLLAIGLQRAVKANDFPRVRALVEAGLRFGLVEGSAPRQAAALLRRLASLPQACTSRSAERTPPG